MPGIVDGKSRYATGRSQQEIHKALTQVGFTRHMTCELGGGDEEYLKDVSERVDKIIVGK